MRKNVVSTLLVGVTIASFALAGCNRTGPDGQQRSENKIRPDVATGAPSSANVGAPPATANSTDTSATGAGTATSPGAGNERQAAAGTSSGQQSGAGARDNQQYSAELQKCDALQGNERMRCADAAKRKHGEM
jgi:hypothetical protein